MMFRSLAISSSLLALLVSGPVMAMEDEGNERSPSPLKRRAAEENLPEGINKKQKILSPEEILQTYPLTPEGNDNLRKAARDGDEAAQDEALIRSLHGKLLFTTEDYDLLLRGFCKWENMEADLRKGQDYWIALQEARQALGDQYREGVKDKMGGWLVTPDPLKAKALLEAAAQHNDAWAQAGLGAMLRKGVKDEGGGWLIAPDPLKAKALLKACINNTDGCIEAPYELGSMLQKGVKDERGGWLIAPDPLKAMWQLEGAAEYAGVYEASSYYKRGVMLRDGATDKNGKEIIKRNLLKAMEYFENAAQDGHEKAKVALQQLQQQDPSQESIGAKINHQSIVQGLANQLLEEMKKNSEPGKKLIAAQQDHQRFSEKLQKTPDVPVGHPQYQSVEETKEFLEVSLKHITQSIETFEKKHKKWLKKNNKYEEMHQTLLTTLVGNMAQDGEITEMANNILLSGLGWTFDPQE